MTSLDRATEGLVRVAAAIHHGDDAALTDVVRAARAGGTAAGWLDELVLMSVLFAGFPRALVAAGALRAVEPRAGEAGDAADYTRWPDWQQRGAETCERVYGSSYQALRRNVRALHPALEAWIIADGYGRTLSRPALDLRRRELCAIAMLVPQQVPRQLHSHLRGALNAGATEYDVNDALAIVEQSSGADIAAVSTARSLWDEVRRGLPS